MFDKFLHLIASRESNNHKAKLLHNSSLIGLTLILLVYQVLITYAPRLKPSVLGYAASISRADVISLTNQKRIEAGFSPLIENPVLSEAAQAKGDYMVKNNFWAHVAPDGTTPWHFFTEFNYKYRYAGENLAKNFSNANDAVNAWMSSPSHKENMLSPNYKDIGIGVVEGNIDGVDTTIIVQFFGTRYEDIAPSQVAQVKPSATSVAKPSLTPNSTPRAVAQIVPTISPTAIPVPSLTPVPASQVANNNVAGSRILISPFITTKGISVALVSILLAILVIDAIVISRRRIARVGGRTFAHLAFLGMILAVALILKVGQVI